MQIVPIGSRRNKQEGTSVENFGMAVQNAVLKRAVCQLVGPGMAHHVGRDPMIHAPRPLDLERIREERRFQDVCERPSTRGRNVRKVGLERKG